MTLKKTKYKRGLIKQLYFAKQMAASQLSKLVKCSIPLTIQNLNTIVQDGFAKEVGLGSSTGGRRALMYSLEANLGYVVAIAMDQFITRMVILDMCNKPVAAMNKFKLPLANNNNSLAQLIEQLNHYIDNSGVDKNKIIGIGIGMPGFVDVKKGINYSFLTPENKQETLAQNIERLVKLPVFIDNDSSLIALAEWRFGKSIGKKNTMVINAGWGVGLGMIVNGSLVRGHQGFAGEFSHIPLFNNNKICSCGKTGCLETETSLYVMVNNAINGIAAGVPTILKQLEATNLEKSADAIIQSASKGDKFSVELISQLGYNIGRGIAVLIHLLNPELVIISGRGSIAGKYWNAPIQQAINEHCIPKMAEQTHIKISDLGYDAEIIGSACLVMENFEQLNYIQQG